MFLFLLDLKRAFRGLLRAPGFAAVAVLSLALGIGANVTVFTWLRQVVLSPLSRVAKPGELVVLCNGDSSGKSMDVSYPDFLDIRDEVAAFRGVSASRWQNLNFQGDAQTERIYGQVVSWNFFEVLAARPALGRFFQREDDRPGQPMAVILSHAFWNRRFGGSPSVLGRSLILNGQPCQVLGIAEEGFLGSIGGLCMDVWVPLEPYFEGQQDGRVLRNRSNRRFFVMARLRPEMNPGKAQALVSALGRELESRHPNTNMGIQIQVLSLGDSPQGIQSHVGRTMSLLMAAVSLLLLIACANVANLLLVRAMGRQREVAIRRSLGAKDLHLLRQFLAEHLILGLAGGCAGLLAAIWGLQLVQVFRPPTYLPLLLQAHLDPAAILFAFGLSLLTCLVFGILPLLHGTRAQPLRALMNSGTPSGSRARIIQDVLVIAELAMAVMLLAATGLLVKSYVETLREGPGFEARGVLVAGLNLGPAKYTPEQSARLTQELRKRLLLLPGVQSLSFYGEVPMGLEGKSWEYVEFDGIESQGAERLRIFRNRVAPGFFETFRIPLLAGRDFTPLDQPGGQPVVIVNETLARTTWPGRDPLGQRIQAGGRWWSVIGVARDCRINTWSEPPTPFIYFSLLQCRAIDWDLALRTTGPTAALVQPLGRILKELDPSLPLLTEDMERLTESSRYQVRMTAQVLGGLALLALFLAAVGVYGVMAYTTQRRNPEIALRMAVGATPAKILSLVLKKGALLAVSGVALGLLGGAALGNAMADLLYRTQPADPVVFSTVTLLLLLAALAACLVPALRAARMEPAETLRSE